MYSPIRVVIADDHRIFREGLKVTLQGEGELNLIGEATNGEELLSIVEASAPDVVLTDIRMPKMDGVQACRLICEKHKSIKVVALSMFNDDDILITMLQAGAAGYLMKNASQAELVNAIKTVNTGIPYYSADTTQRLASIIGAQRFSTHRLRPPVNFSQRELDIIQLIYEEYMNKEIAAKLKISIRTVESHKNNILEKTGAKNSVGIVLYAIKHNLANLKDKKWLGACLAITDFCSLLLAG